MVIKIRNRPPNGEIAPRRSSVNVEMSTQFTVWYLKRDHGVKEVYVFLSIKNRGNYLYPF